MSFWSAAESRRFGKSVLGTNRLMESALAGHPTAWFAPTYKYLLPIWSELLSLLRPVISRSSFTDKRIDLITGGSIEMWTCDGPDPALGRKYKRVVIDEAAIIEKLEYIWEKCLEPTLLDLDGDAWFLSTPKGYNYFHTLYQRGLDVSLPEWACYQAPTTANPTLPNAAAYLERKRKTIDENTFTQEYLAEFIRGGGAVFRRVLEAATGTARDKAEPGRRYVFGADFGRTGDFTVISVIDIEAREQVALDRFTGIPFSQQQDRIAALAGRFSPTLILAESNSFGQSNIEALQGMGLPVRGWVASNATKTAMIDDLAVAFEKGTLKILPDPVQRGELMAFEASKTATGLTRYAAPNGMHDDCCIALGLSLLAASSGTPQTIESFW